MAGSQSWIETYTMQPTPCITNTPGQSTLSSCVLWLVIGLVLGSISFQKKGTQS